MPLKSRIRTIPDYPKPGILFRDITTLLQDPFGFRKLIDDLVQPFTGNTIDAVAGIEARGFIFAPALAYNLNAGFIPIRKPGKLPSETETVTYDLEYGTDTLEIHKEAFPNRSRVIIADDLLATGGTAKAAAESTRRCRHGC